jgi:integrase
VFAVENPRKAVASACKVLGYPAFTIHALRHFFITNAIEAGLDFRAVAGLVNHSDGGALLARRYAHLRDSHLAASVKKLTFDATVDERKNVVGLQETA